MMPAEGACGRTPGARQRPRKSDSTVVGVVGDVRYRGLTDVRLDCYMPVSQSRNRVQALVVRTAREPRDLLRSIRAAAAAAAPGATVGDVAVMDDVIASESAPWRFLLRLFLAFAALAGAVAAVGLGAVVSLSVATRWRELAIRAAVGASEAQLSSATLFEGLQLVSVGLLVGVAGALALGRLVGHILVGVAPHDPLALLVAVVVVAGVSFVAIALPARRAAAVHPLEALRAE